ncbi:gliding motility-associated C-terminal domain-containing protein [Chitinophagaceae bacterium LB-8]|uniref:Gliding motility-associated C-terminal domain-containing protein n=1 Tax=Paraflavisolibacter caeni TaxID=2982496 RepID=A0A9X2Y1Z3_9BACT|nr:gliding motility-associated C-terminal domain-containing protein [Paraflavisolibacter caeni]MCU7552018.1 gliding motility-associated C-terminal domain-containing protein [Paraflavisolibacter caeni]
MAAPNLTSKHLVLFIFLAFSLVQPTYSQVLIQWQKCLGGTNDDNARSIRPTRDGGYIAIGTSMSTNGDVSKNYGSIDFWVIKMDKNGSVQWQYSLGGSKSDMAYSVEQTSDNGYIIAGYSDSRNGLLSYNQGSTDFWLTKLDINGQLQWQRTFGGSSQDNAHSVIQTQDGGFVIAGSTRSNDGDVSGNHGNFDGWVVKIDASGVPLWIKCYGGTGIDEIQSIQQTSDGGYIMTGYTTSSNGDVSGQHGAEDLWVVKIDGRGNLLWQKALGGTGADTGESIRQTEDGGYIVAGTTKSNNGDVSGNHGDVDAWVVKLDPNGNLQWQKCYGGSGQDQATCISQTADKGFLIGAQTASSNGDVSGNHGGLDYWVVRTDGFGNIQWQQCFGGSGSDMLASLEPTKDGWFVAIGSTTSQDGDVTGIHGSSHDYWVVKFGGCMTMAPEVTITASDMEVCAGDSVTFTANAVNTGAVPTYQWQLNGANTGATTPTYNSNALKQGDEVSCILTIKVPGCPTSTIQSNKEVINIRPLPTIHFTPSELSAMTGEQLQLNPAVSGTVASVEWTSVSGVSLQNPQSLTPTTAPLTTNSTFQLSVVDNYGCKASGEVLVKVFDKYYMPNSFTPNGDGKNDVFRIPFGASLQLDEFSIFDRWGNRIFITKDAGKGWDGTYQGKALQTGTFVYLVRGKSREGVIQLKGVVTLVR